MSHNAGSPDPEIDEIVAELQQEIRTRQLELGASARRSPRREASMVDDLLDQVQAAARVDAHPPIAWPTWPKGVWPMIVALAQKVVRRLLRWYINPLVAQQNAYNAAVAELLARMAEQHRELTLRLDQVSATDRRIESDRSPEPLHEPVAAGSADESHA